MDVTQLTALIVAVFGGAGVSGIITAVSAWRSGVKNDEREAAADLARERDAAEAEAAAAIRSRNEWRELSYRTRIVAIENGVPFEALPVPPSEV